jgi:hypothetical protein
LLKDELAIWAESEALLNDFFDELRQNGLLRPLQEWNREAVHQMRLIFKRVSGRFATNNALNRAIQVKNLRDKIEDYLIKLDFGFKAGDLTNLWAYYYFGAFVEDTELMRKNLLIVLRSGREFLFRQRMTLGQLTSAIRKNCPKHGVAFVDKVGVPLRNAFAHGLYWLVGDSSSRAYIQYCEELGTAPKTERFWDVLLRMRRYNLLSACLNATLLEKMNAEWFVS